LHFKPAPDVRDFAQQIAHAAVPVAVFAASAKGEKPPALGDSTVYLNSKAALRERSPSRRPTSTVSGLAGSWWGISDSTAWPRQLTTCSGRVAE
jgi:hypothetical protein